jgi:hypothetical protein
MRIAFVVQTHTNPAQIRHLMRTLNAGCPDRLLVLSHNGDLDNVKSIAHEQSVDVLLSGSASARGRFGLVQSYLNALSWLEAQSMSYDWLIHMSGQDYPVAPLRTLREFLQASPYDGFFHYFDPFDRDDAGREPMNWAATEGSDRYLFQYRLLRSKAGLPIRAAAWLPRHLLARTRAYRLHTGFGLMLGVSSADLPFSERMKCYAGSFWQIINKRCVEAILDEDARNRKLRDYYRAVILPDESYTQTILLNRPGLNLSSRDLRYYSFAGQRRGQSKTLQIGDLGKVLGSKYFLARKFDTSKDPAILDYVDSCIL